MKEITEFNDYQHETSISKNVWVTFNIHTAYFVLSFFKHFDDERYNKVKIET